MQSNTAISTRGDDGNPRVQRRSGPLTGMLTMLALVVTLSAIAVVALVATALLLPLLLVLLVLFGSWYTIFLVRRSWLRARLHDHNRDGRENVRVRGPRS